jgi:hypothetical protein
MIKFFTIYEEAVSYIWLRTRSLWISLYMRKIYFLFYQCTGHIKGVLYQLIHTCLWWFRRLEFASVLKWPSEMSLTLEWLSAFYGACTQGCFFSIHQLRKGTSEFSDDLNYWKILSIIWCTGYLIDFKHSLMTLSLKDLSILWSPMQYEDFQHFYHSLMNFTLGRF